MEINYEGERPYILDNHNLQKGMLYEFVCINYEYVLNFFTIRVLRYILFDFFPSSS